MIFEVLRRQGGESLPDRNSNHPRTSRFCDSTQVTPHCPPPGIDIRPWIQGVNFHFASFPSKLPLPGRVTAAVKSTQKRENEPRKRHRFPGVTAETVQRNGPAAATVSRSEPTAWGKMGTLHIAFARSQTAS